MGPVTTDENPYRAPQEKPLIAPASPPAAARRGGRKGYRFRAPFTQV